MTNQGWNNPGDDPDNPSATGQDGSQGGPDSATPSSWGYGEPGAGSTPYGQPEQGPIPSYGQSAPGSYSQPTYGQSPYGEPPQAPGAGYGGTVPAGDPYGVQDPTPYGAPVYPGYDPALQGYGYGAPTAVNATWGRRALGGLIDFVVPGIIISVIVNIVTSMTFGAGTTTATQASNTWPGLLNLVWWGVLAFLSGATGQTPGRKLAKTRLVSEVTGQPIGVGKTFVRYLCHYLDSLACAIGWLFPLWDRKRQTFADKIVKTVVRDESGGTPGGPSQRPY